MNDRQAPHHFRPFGSLPLLALAVTLASAAHAQSSAPASARPCPVRPASERPWLDKGLSPECRADALIARMGSIEEKLQALGAGFARYGVEEARGSDGPVGPTHGGDPISLPSPLALAASFDPALAAEVGRLVGHEFRAAGMRRMLGPTIDIARTWHAGRVPEGYGEDPVLTASIAAPFVRAVQGEGVAATLKHYAAYSQEQGRTGDLPFGTQPAVNVIVSQRAMRELYLPGFRAAVVEGGALGIMCAFPRINGVYACENAHLLGILKQEWGFRGTVGPDFPDAQRSVIEAVNAGLDSGNFGLRPPAPPPPPPGAGAPGGPPPGGPNLGAALGLDAIPGGIGLRDAVRQGKVGVARIDDMLRRALVSQFAVDGIPDRGPVDPAEAAATALRAAESGTVLLRNERGILPFGPSVHSIAVIGAQAGPRPQVATSGSAYVPAKNPISALEAIRARAGAATVSYAPGSLGLDALPLVPPEVFHTPDGIAGLRADYVANPNLDFGGPAILTRTESAIDSRGPMPAPGLPGAHRWSVRWSGTLTPRTSGMHSFTIAGAGSGRLYVGGRLAARFDRVDFGTIEHAVVALEAGKPVDIRVEYTPREAAPLPAIPLLGTTLGAAMQFGWAEPDDRIAEAAKTARAADVVVVFAANRQGEGADRASLNLPGDQDALIAAVAAANPRTIVVLSTGGAVAMPWRDKVAGILEMWYSGQSFGPAAARLLFGDAAPGGRLPISFPADPSQGPGAVTASYPGTVDANGALDALTYDEDMLVGYRWFDANPKREPLFPFGYGLTYSATKLSQVAAAPDGDGVRVHAIVENPGGRAASEVVQVYLALPGAAGEPPKKLAAFVKVTLNPGERRAVELAIPATAFDIWDERSGQWRPWHGRYQLIVGRSSGEADARVNLTR